MGCTRSSPEVPSHLSYSVILCFCTLHPRTIFVLFCKSQFGFVPRDLGLYSRDKTLCLLTLSDGRKKGWWALRLLSSFFSDSSWDWKEFSHETGLSKTPLSLVKPFGITGSRRLWIQLTEEANISVGLRQHLQHWGWRKGWGGEGMELVFMVGLPFWWKVSPIWLFLYLSWRYTLAVPHFLASQLQSRGGDFPTHSPHLNWLFLFPFLV